MNDVPAGFTDRLRTAVAGRAGASLVLVGNFEVEEQWSRGEHTLPRMSAPAGSAVVNHMDEFALLLGESRDHVVLKSAPDEDYLGYLGELGVPLPAIHVVREQDPGRTVTEDALADPKVLNELSLLPDAVIVAHGVSEVEERLAARTGLPLAAPDAALCKAVNSKVYSRRVADDLGLRQPAGFGCETLADLRVAFDWAGTPLAEGRAVVIKEAFGVSGKGIAVLRDERRLDRLYRMIAKQVERSGQDRIAFVVEEWVAKKADLNYQFTVGRDGSVHFDFVKEALTEGGVHKGHRFPARLSTGAVSELVTSAEQIGKRLAEDGFFGVVGVDALLDAGGGIYPVIEINARNNMSTYQVRLQERFVGPGSLALAKHYPVRLNRPTGFGVLRELLGGLLFDGRKGLLVNNFATVNAAADPENPAPFDGRLYGVIVAGTADELSAIDDQVAARLAAIKEDH
ncbi:ATP-grasp domain-containing protein [Actinocrispum sp. NPDC049592]|uniref:preATP grasp domain-containing protein n=1 Tax=Actinocrispum sp. NPDC049592 TaxID=3154835 RepID=UPI00342F50DF